MTTTTRHLQNGDNVDILPTDNYIYRVGAHQQATRSRSSSRVQQQQLSCAAACVGSSSTASAALLVWLRRWHAAALARSCRDLLSDSWLL